MIKALILLADSRLLFQKLPDGRLLLEGRIPAGGKAVYLGASNGEVPGYYQIFQEAMNKIGLENTVHADWQKSEVGAAHLAAADLILLAGGDPVLGWSRLAEAGYLKLIRQRYAEGACITGISAGAVQLGMGLYSEDTALESGEDCRDFNTESDAETGPNKPFGLIPGFNLLPYFIEAHEEASGWKRLHRMAGEGCPGLGLPYGTGATWHPESGLKAYGGELFLLPRDLAP